MYMDVKSQHTEKVIVVGVLKQQLPSRNSRFLNTQKIAIRDNSRYVYNGRRACAGSNIIYRSNHNFTKPSWH